MGIILQFYFFHLILFFSYGFVFCCLRFLFLLFRWLEHDAVVSVSLFFLYFLCLWSLQLGVTSAEKLLCLLCKTISKVSYLIIILWTSLEKGEYFDFNHSLGCVYPIIRLLGRVYHFNLLIFYSCLFILHANLFQVIKGRLMQI